LRLSAFRLRIFSFLLFFPFFPSVIAGQKARSAVFDLKAPGIHAEATLANASTGICLLDVSMDHRVKPGGDESESGVTVALSWLGCEDASRERDCVSLHVSRTRRSVKRCAARRR
jgi:hypothetical protein